MTIHGSGTPIYMHEIQAEFGGGNPMYLSNYYAGGPYVPAGTVGEFGPIPGPGVPLYLHYFYGASKARIITFGGFGGGSGYIEGGYGSIVPNPGGAGYPFGSERIIAFNYAPGSPNAVYLDVAGSWAKTAFGTIDMPGKGGYSGAAANLYVIQGGYTRWRWNTSTNPFLPVGGTSSLVFY